MPLRSRRHDGQYRPGRGDDRPQAGQHQDAGRLQGQEGRDAVRLDLAFPPARLPQDQRPDPARRDRARHAPRRDGRRLDARRYRRRLCLEPGEVQAAGGRRRGLQDLRQARSRRLRHRRPDHRARPPSPAANPDAVVGLLKAYGRALTSIRAKPDEAAALVGKQAGVSAAGRQGRHGGIRFRAAEEAARRPTGWATPGKPGKFAERAEGHRGLPGRTEEHPHARPAVARVREGHQHDAILRQGGRVSAPASSTSTDVSVALRRGRRGGAGARPRRRSLSAGATSSASSAPPAAARRR